MTKLRFRLRDLTASPFKDRVGIRTRSHPVTRSAIMPRELKSISPCIIAVVLFYIAAEIDVQIPENHGGCEEC